MCCGGIEKHTGCGIGSGRTSYMSRVGAEECVYGSVRELYNDRIGYASNPCMTETYMTKSQSPRVYKLPELHSQQYDHEGFFVKPKLQNPIKPEAIFAREIGFSYDITGDLLLSYITYTNDKHTNHSANKMQTDWQTERDELEELINNEKLRLIQNANRIVN